jgi:hypothetical protein
VIALGIAERTGIATGRSMTSRRYTSPSGRPDLVVALRSLGHDIVVDPPDGVSAFGGAQIVMRAETG